MTDRLTIFEIEAIVKSIACPPFTFKFSAGLEMYLQVQDLRPDSSKPAGKRNKPVLQSGRKWRISHHMTRGEIVQTALRAALDFAAHEVREAFKYQGQPIFSPHYDVEKLAAFARQQKPFEIRKPRKG